MFVFFRCSFLASIALLFFLPAAHANIDDIRWENNGLGFSVGGQDMKYGESDATGTLDTENGWMPNFNLSYDMMLGQHKWYTFLNNLYLHIDGGITIGDTTYKGSLQQISGGTVVLTPTTGTTDSQIYTIGAKIGRGIALGNQVMLTPFGDLGYRYWVRDLTGPGGYEETYSNGELGAGLMAQWSPFSHWVLTLSGEAGTTLGPSVHSDIGDGVDLSLGSSAIWKGSAKIGYAFSKSLEVNAAVQLQGFGYGASGQEPVTVNGAFTGIGISEPSSYTHETTLLVGLFYHI